MASIRFPAVAGMFYPDNPAQLSKLVGSLLDQALSAKPPPKAMIVPHAGYIYSGSVAATGYARLLNRSHEYDRVIVLGPAHRYAFSGLAIPTVDAFETPLGRVYLDKKGIEKIKYHENILMDNKPHAQEHSIEVQIPFLQIAINSPFKLIPIVVGEASPLTVQEILEILWNGKKTLIVVSSDLSHYLNYDSAKQLDNETSQAIINFQPKMISYNQACGRIPIQGLLLAAKKHNLQSEMISLRNSGDTAGPKNQVVGYGTYVFE